MAGFQSELFFQGCHQHRIGNGNQDPDPNGFLGCCIERINSLFQLLAELFLTIELAGSVYWNVGQAGKFWLVPGFRRNPTSYHAIRVCQYPFGKDLWDPPAGRIRCLTSFPERFVARTHDERVMERGEILDGAVP